MTINAGHLADLILSTIHCHTDEDTSPETIFEALRIIESDISAEYAEGQAITPEGRP